MARVKDLTTAPLDMIAAAMQKMPGGMKGASGNPLLQSGPDISGRLPLRARRLFSGMCCLRLPRSSISVAFLSQSSQQVMFFHVRESWALDRWQMARAQYSMT